MKANLFIIKNIYSVLLIVIDTFFLILFRAINFHRIKSDYFLSNIGGLGDSILFLSLILKNKSSISSKGEVHLLINESYTSMFEKLKDSGFKIHTLNPKKYSRNLIYRIKSNFFFSRFQVKSTAKIRGGRNGIFDDSVIRFVNGEKIGLRHNSNDTAVNGLFPIISKFIEKLFFDQIIDFNSNYIVHEFQRNSLLMSNLFNLDNDNLIFDNDCFIETENYFNNPSILIDKKYCVLNIGANNIKRKWSVENFIILGKIIEEKHSLIPVFCGLDIDSLMLKNSNEIISNNSINLCGKLSLEELINIIKNSSLCISNDSGPANLAVSLNVSSITIKNSFSNYRFFPLPQDSSYKNHVTISGKNLDDITVKMVEKEIEKILFH